MSQIKILIDSEQREEYLDILFSLDLLPKIRERKNRAYCAVALTSIPRNVQPHVRKRQEILVQNLLPAAKIKAYDPMGAPLSPDKGLKADPAEVYQIDSIRILESRFFVGHNLISSYGVGIELEKAVHFNRIPVIFFDRKIRFSRMLPHRAIYLAYDNFEKQWRDFVPVFEMLKNYEPGMGVQNGKSVLVGFEKNSHNAVNLEESVRKEFPRLVFHYDRGAQIVETIATNSGLFYEHRQNA
jgi:hypothetical protein